MIMDLFDYKTPVINTKNLNLLYEIFVGIPALTAKQFDYVYSFWEGYGPIQPLGKKKEKLMIDLFFYEAPVLNNAQLKKLDYIYEKNPQSGKMSMAHKSKLY